MRRAQPWRTNRARALRSKSSAAEDILWANLRNRQFDGLKFVRQTPIGPFFADFLCRELKLVVEIDGGTHSTDEEIENDARRSAYLQRNGYIVFRTHNTEIYENLDGVLDTLMEFIGRRDG